jgi:hypothetical protein
MEQHMQRPRFLQVEAIGVLLNNIGDLGRGYDFAKHCNDSEVWSVLARAQLDGHHTTEAIDSYIKANDASNFVGTNPSRHVFPLHRAPQTGRTGCKNTETEPGRPAGRPNLHRHALCRTVLDRFPYRRDLVCGA